MTGAEGRGQAGGNPADGKEKGERRDVVGWNVEAVFWNKDGKAMWHAGFVVEVAAEAASGSSSRGPAERFRVYYPMDGIDEWFPRPSDPTCAQLAWKKRRTVRPVADRADVQAALSALRES